MTKASLEATLEKHEKWMVGLAALSAVSTLGAFATGWAIALAGVATGSAGGTAYCAWRAFDTKALLKPLIESEQAASRAEVAEAKARADAARAAAAAADERAAEAHRTLVRAQEEAEKERAARLQLEARLAPRSLTSQQRATLLASLRPYAGTVITVACVWGDSESETFTAELKATLEEAGWSVDGINQATFDPPPPRGVLVVVAKPEVPGHVEGLRQALVSSGIDALGVVQEANVGLVARTGAMLLVGVKPA